MFPRLDAFYATQIDAAFRRVCAPLVVHIDAAGLAEMMFRRAGTPSIERQIFSPFDDLDRGRGCGDCGGLSARAERTGASGGVR